MFLMMMCVGEERSSRVMPGIRKIVTGGDSETEGVYCLLAVMSLILSTIEGSYVELLLGKIDALNILILKIWKYLNRKTLISEDAECRHTPWVLTDP